MAHASTPFGIVLLLGFIAGLANVVGGLLMLRMRAERFLHGFVAFGAGFLIAVASGRNGAGKPSHLRRRRALLDSCRLLRRFICWNTLFSPHLHMGEETHTDEFLHRSTAYSVTCGPHRSHIFRRRCHRQWIRFLRYARMAGVYRRAAAQTARRFHRRQRHARQWTQRSRRIHRCLYSGRSGPSPASEPSTFCPA